MLYSYNNKKECLYKSGEGLKHNGYCSIQFVPCIFMKTIYSENFCESKIITKYFLIQSPLSIFVNTISSQSIWDNNFCTGYL